MSAEQASELLGRLKGHRGAGTLRRALMHAHPEIAETRSRLEVLFLELMTSEIDIPEPALNVRIGPVEVDVLWADVGLIVELDGRAFHIDPARFEADRERTAYLERLGYRVLRLTWRMVNFERTATVRKVRAHRRLAARDSRTPSLPGPTAPPDR